jgi:hypothetical protein
MVLRVELMLTYRAREVATAKMLLSPRSLSPTAYNRHFESYKNPIEQAVIPKG